MPHPSSDTGSLASPNFIALTKSDQCSHACTIPLSHSSAHANPNRCTVDRSKCRAEYFTVPSPIASADANPNRRTFDRAVAPPDPLLRKLPNELADGDPGPISSTLSSTVTSALTGAVGFADGLVRHDHPHAASVLAHGRALASAVVAPFDRAVPALHTYGRAIVWALGAACYAAAKHRCPGFHHRAGDASPSECE